MESFSQRKGLKQVKSVIQVDSLDDNLRNRLWSVLYTNYFSNERFEDYQYYISFCALLWNEYFKYPIDTLSNDPHDVREIIRKYFFGCKWHEVYDFIEFTANNYGKKRINSNFVSECNRVLEKELSAYRFVGGKIVEITTKEEITEIEQALEIPLNPVKQHIEQALTLLSDRKSPDYRNSIKESISAVETISKLIAKDDKATLGKALQVIERTGDIELHPVLKVAFDKLYAYTSDEDGIRHGMLDEPNISFEDAKFMLVSCSAFVNYLVTKASKAGITI